MRFLVSISIFLFSAFTGFVQASPQIIDGRDSKKHEFPSVVSIEVFIGNEMSICTATFVSDNTLLTAAHCVYRFLEAKENKIDAEIILPERFSLKKVLIHQVYKNIKDEEKNGVPGYEYLKLANDLALIVMNGNKSKVHMGISTHPKLGKASMVGFGGKNLLTVSQMNQRPDDTIGIKRIGSLYIEDINSLGRIDSKRRVFNTRSWFDFSDRYSLAFDEKTSVFTRGDSGGPLIQEGKVVGVIAGTDATQQDEKKVFSVVNYFAGLHSSVFAQLLDEAKKNGSSIR